MLPLIPVALASTSSLVAAVGGWCYMKYEQLDLQMKVISEQAKQIERSADSAVHGSVWSELLEPVAKRWGGALKAMAFSIVGASACFVLIGIGACVEIRRLRCETSIINSLKDELRALRKENEDLRARLTLQDEQT